MLFKFFDAFRKRRAKADTTSPTWKFTPVYGKSPADAKPEPVRRERKDLADLSQFLQLSNDVNMEGILKILTKDHDIVHYNDDDILKAESGWYGLIEKQSEPGFGLRYIFSNLCAAIQGDRNEFDDLATFDRIEFNMAGLAAFIHRFREKPSSPYASVQEKLRAAETDSEKQLIIQEAFGAQDWRNIDIKSPAGTVSVNVSCDTDAQYHRFSYTLEGRGVFHYGTSVSVYEKLAALVIGISECLPFIEQYIPQAPPEVKLGTIRIML